MEDRQGAEQAANCRTGVRRAGKAPAALRKRGERFGEGGFVPPLREKTTINRNLERSEGCD